MAGKRVFPPEWYAAQAARRKQRAEAKSQGPSAKESGSTPKPSKKKSNSNIYHIRGSDPLMAYRISKDVLGGTKSYKTYEYTDRKGHSSSTTFYAKKDGGLAASSTRNYGKLTRHGDLTHTKVRKSVSPLVYKRYLRLRERALKNAKSDDNYRVYQKNSEDYRKSSRG